MSFARMEISNGTNHNACGEAKKAAIHESGLFEEINASETFSIDNFVNGQFYKTDEYLSSFNPANAKVWAKVPSSYDSDVLKAVDAAKVAFPLWSSLTVAERAKYLNALADAVEEHVEEFAVAESTDQGKPVWLARQVDIPRAIYNFRYFAGYVPHHEQKSSHQPEFGVVNYTLQQPCGVAGLISPWNLPLYLLTFKLAPALAAGCTVVCKPSELTSVTAWMLCKLVQKLDFPPGVVNMVFGRGETAGSALVQHPSVPVISFTGSTATADKIRLAAGPCKKLSLELGGKNPCIIFEDAEYSRRMADIVRACFTNQGEVCTCASRLFVHRSIFSAFLAQFVAAVQALKVGDPKDPETKVGALVSKEHLAKVSFYVDLAMKEKAKIECGGSRLENTAGYFFAPTVITDVSDASRLMTEEIFGPVVCVVPFDGEDEVLARANSVQYGLAATVWTTDLGKAFRVAHRLQAGTVWTNCWMVRDLGMPFGGGKQSGVGREGGPYSMEFYTEHKTVCMKYT